MHNSASANKRTNEENDYDYWNDYWNDDCVVVSRCFRRQ